MSAHTPGPWSFIERKPTHECYGKSAIECLIRVGEGPLAGNVLAIVGLGGKGATSYQLDDVRANANLIAAAPDLLAALNRLLDGFSPEAVAQANLAIAKAEGR